MFILNNTHTETHKTTTIKEKEVTNLPAWSIPLEHLKGEKVVIILYQKIRKTLKKSQVKIKPNTKQVKLRNSKDLINYRSVD